MALLGVPGRRPPIATPRGRRPRAHSAKGPKRGPDVPRASPRSHQVAAQRGRVMSGTAPTAPKALNACGRLQPEARATQLPASSPPAFLPRPNRFWVGRESARRLHVRPGLTARANWDPTGPPRALLQGLSRTASWLWASALYPQAHGAHQRCHRVDGPRGSPRNPRRLPLHPLPHDPPGALPEAPARPTLLRDRCSEGLTHRLPWVLPRTGSHLPDSTQEPGCASQDLRPAKAGQRLAGPEPHTRLFWQGPSGARARGAGGAGGAGGCGGGGGGGGVGVGGGSAGGGGGGGYRRVTEGKLSLAPTFCPGGDNVLDLSFDENDGREFSLILFSFSKECRMRESSSIRAHWGPPGQRNGPGRVARRGSRWPQSPAAAARTDPRP